MFDDAAEMPEKSYQPVFDGRFSFGPVKGIDGKRLLQRLTDFNLSIPRGEGDMINARMTRQGFMIEVEGPGIVGYLLDEEGVQPEEDLLEEFAVDLLKANDTLVIEGEHLVHKDIKMMCKTVIRMDESLPRPHPVVEVFMTRVGAGIGVDNMRKG
jgi:hypothetical protein